MQLGHPPVVYILAAAHRIGKMHLPTIAIIDIRERRRHSAFGHYGVRFPQQRFADEPNAYARRRRLYRSAQTGSACADHEHVVFECWVLSHREMFVKTK